MDPSPARLLVLHGGIVLFVGMLAGLRYGAALVRDPDTPTARDWRIVHVQNLQNGMLLLLAAACASYLRLSPSALSLMAWLFVVSAYTDMAAWFVRAGTGHSGMLPTPPAGNVVVFALFGVTMLGQFGAVALLVFGAWKALS